MSKHAYIELTERPSGLVRLRVVPCESAPVEVARQRRAFINSDEFPDSKSGYGKLPRATSFGPKSKKLVREYSASIERAYTKSHCRFITATFPGSGDDVYEVIAAWSGWITAQLNQWLRDASPFTDFVYVWEHQKRGALHLHYLIANHDKKRLRIVHRRFKTFWKRLLNTLCKKSGVDVWKKSDGSSWRMTPHVVRTAVQPVKKSVARYLAKYLSKHASKETTEGALSPSRWWGASAGARKLYAAFSKRVVSALMPISEATEAAAAAMANSDVAAMPVFEYQSAWQSGLRAWVVCASPLNSENIFNALLSGGIARFHAPAKIDLAITDFTPPPPNLWEAALFFNGKVVEKYGLGLRVLAGAETLQRAV